MDQKINGSKAKPGASFRRKMVAAAVAPVIVLGGAALPMAASAAEPISTGIRALAPFDVLPEGPQAVSPQIREDGTTYAVDISWGAPSDATAAAAVTGYRVEVIAPNSINNQVTTVGANTYSASFSGLAQQSGFGVRVTVLTAAGDGATTQSMFTTDAIVPGVPSSSIVATPVTVNGDTYFDISWASAGPGYSYSIRVEDEYNNGYGGNGGTFYVNDGSPLTTRIGGNLTSNKEYRILVTTKTTPGTQAGYFSKPVEVKATSGWNALNPVRDVTASSPADGTFTVNWNAPLSNGTVAADYTVELLQEVDGVKVPVDDKTFTTRTASFTNLATGVYSARVTARTAGGDLSRATTDSVDVSVTAAEIETAPVFASQPTSQVAVSGDGVIFTVTGEGLDAVSWELYDAAADEWTTIGDNVGATFVWAVPPTVPGEYSVRAVATNSAGSTISTAAVLTVIEAPEGLPVFSKNLGAVTQLWANQDINLEIGLEDSAGTTIAWELRTADGAWEPIVGQTSPTLNLAAGLPVAYTGGQIRAAATNAAGTSYSVTTLDIDWQTTSPGAPLRLAATDGKLTWEAPAENGGPGVERYAVLVLQGDEEITSAIVPADGPLEWAGLDALAPGDYTIFVVAGNSFGTSASEALSYTRQSSGGGETGGENTGGTDGENTAGGNTAGGTGTAAANGEKSDLARTGAELSGGFGLAALLAGIAGIGLTLIGRKKKSTI